MSTDSAMLVAVILIPLTVFTPLIYFWIIDLHKQAKLRKLKEKGMEVKATIVGLKQAVYLGTHDANIRKYVAEATINGTRYQFESEQIAAQHCKLREGDEITILVLQEDPSQYYFNPYEEEFFGNNST